MKPPAQAPWRGAQCSHIGCIGLRPALPLQIGKCTPRGTCTPGWEPLVWSFVINWQFRRTDHNGSHKPVTILSPCNCTHDSHIIQNENFTCVLYAHSQFMCSLRISNCQPWAGPALSRCNRCDCIGPRASGVPRHGGWAVVYFCQILLPLENYRKACKSHC